MPRHSILEYLENFQRPDTAYVHRRGYRSYRWSYREVAEVAAQFARELESRQIGKGDHVLLWGENCAEWVAVFWGCILRGAVVIPMDRTAAPDFVRRVADQVAQAMLHAERQQTEQVIQRLAKDVANKTGTLDESRNDAAIVRGEPTVVVAAFTRKLRDTEAAVSWLGVLGWCAYRAAGNAGGALVTMKGELVGVACNIKPKTPWGQSGGVGFACLVVSHSVARMVRK